MTKTALYRVLLLLLALHSVVYLDIYAHDKLASHSRLGGDFPTFFKRGQMVLSHASAANIYDTAPLDAQAAGTLDLAADPLPPFPYPPYTLLFLWPLGFFSYHAALGVWLTISAALYLCATLKNPASQNLPSNMRAYIIPFILLSPLALYNIVTAQNGFFTAALLIAAITLSQRRPYAAGICAALLTVKPQLALMLPVLFLAQKNGKAVLAAALTCLALVLAATLQFGPGCWPIFLSYLASFTHMVAADPGLLTQMNASLYRSLLINGLPQPIALAVQGFVIAAAAASCWLAARNPADASLRHAIILTASLIAAPHVMTYDMPALIIPVFYLLNHALRATERPYELLAMLFLLVSPILALHSPQLPIAFAAMVACLLLLVLRLKTAQNA